MLRQSFFSPYKYTFELITFTFNLYSFANLIMLYLSLGLTFQQAMQMLECCTINKFLSLKLSRDGCFAKIVFPSHCLMIFQYRSCCLFFQFFSCSLHGIIANNLTSGNSFFNLSLIIWK